MPARKRPKAAGESRKGGFTKKKGNPKTRKRVGKNVRIRKPGSRG